MVNVAKGSRSLRLDDNEGNVNKPKVDLDAYRTCKTIKLWI